MIGYSGNHGFLSAAAERATDDVPTQDIHLKKAYIGVLAAASNRRAYSRIALWYIRIMRNLLTTKGTKVHEGKAITKSA